MKGKLILMMAIATFVLIVVPVLATPQTYATGDTCVIPTDDYFLDNPYGIPGFMSYSLDVVPGVWQDGRLNPNGNHYTGLDDKTPYKLGQSHAVQEKLALIKQVYCYTLPDANEIKTFTSQKPISPAPKNIAGAIGLDGRIFVPRPGATDGQAYEAV